MIDDDLFVKLFDSTPERQNGGDDDGPVYFGERAPLHQVICLVLAMAVASL